MAEHVDSAASVSVTLIVRFAASTLAMNTEPPPGGDDTTIS